MKKLLFLSVLVISLVSCSKDDPEPVGTMFIKFDSGLRAHPDATINYYVTNIQLKSADGSVHTSNLAFSIDAGQLDSEMLKLNDTPLRTYNEVSFTVAIIVTGDIEYNGTNLKYKLATADFTVDATKQPTVYLKLDITKLKDDSANAITYVQVR